MLMLIAVVVLIALVIFAITRHWKIRNNRIVRDPNRHTRRR